IWTCIMLGSLWIHQYRSVAPPVFLCYGRKWCDNIRFSGGQVTEMRLHGDFETLEPEIDCSAVDTQRTNVRKENRPIVLSFLAGHESFARS
uniref:Uncharacterized protein n=1 Tax=Sparus aurata TaxID=8175 RepID=A0A671XBS5_SPAAU